MTSKDLSSNSSAGMVLLAKTEYELTVISTLVQDSVLLKKNIKWIKKRHRFAILLHRFRWELIEEASGGLSPGRSRCALIFDGVLKVSTNNLENTLREGVLSLLSLRTNIQENLKEIELIFSGGGSIRLLVEFIYTTMNDLELLGSEEKSMIPSHDI